MDLKKHIDTIVILTAMCGSMIWMNGKFSDIDKEIASLKTEMAVIKTVLLMKNIIPSELVKVEVEK